MSRSLRSRFYRVMLRLMFRDRTQSLAQLRAGSGMPALPSILLPKGTSILPVDAGGVAAEWVVPPSARTDTAVLHLHGGGYVSGSARLERLLASGLAASAEARVLVPDYRLAPEHPFPAALDDAVAAYRFLLHTGYKVDSIVVSGDSAGGGLAMALVLSLRDAGEPLPAAMVLMSPWADMELRNPGCTTNAEVESLLRVDTLRQWADWYAHGADPAVPLLSPVNADFSGLPPMLIQVGSDEILLDDARTLARKAAAAGVAVTLSEWDGLWHCWQILGALVPENTASFAEIRGFLEPLLPTSPRS
ncbi:MAG TPA: alpha/beta hydrolase [bacterium]|nr:alpha/beta hydrolase [bacterium]